MRNDLRPPALFEEEALEEIRIRYERSGATPSPSSPRAMRYGATIRDWGTWEHAGWAGRSRTMSRELALVFGRPCDLPECAVSANP